VAGWDDRIKATHWELLLEQLQETRRGGSDGG
jgi:hypothetical protein